MDQYFSEKSIDKKMYDSNSFWWILDVSYIPIFGLRGSKQVYNCPFC
jgi:hypothetical protein